MKQQQRMVIMKDLLWTIRSKGRTDAENRWWRCRVVGGRLRESVAPSRMRRHCAEMVSVAGFREAVQGNQIRTSTIAQRMEGRGRRPGERWLHWYLRTFGGLVRAEAMGFHRADKMVIAKRWNCAGHVARIWTTYQTLHQLLEMRYLTWWRDHKRRWRSNRQFHRRPGIQRRWERRFDGNGTKSGREWETLAKDRSRFGAGLKEFTKTP